jgi:hypothetical protein
MNTDCDEQTAIRDHDAIMADVATVLRRYNAPLVYKRMDNARVKQDVQDLLDGDGDANGDEPWSPFTNEQTDIIIYLISEFRQEVSNMIDDAVVEAVAPLKERIAMLEGQVSTLVMLISDNGKSFEAVETVRKMRIGR